MLPKKLHGVSGASGKGRGCEAETLSIRVRLNYPHLTRPFLLPHFSDISPSQSARIWATPGAIASRAGIRRFKEDKVEGRSAYRAIRVTERCLPAKCGEKPLRILRRLR